ncbi:MAG: hypothetical protein KRP56_02695 [Candidatus Methanogranum gryphiswaldense]|nr:MAG: hypothetical protein KRP56_02695 [Candidatus Methanogranum sp. U3.2.1]
MDTAGDDSKMKMKMNKNKTMLALIVVAALALCSVAVVANESDDSSAAGTSTIDAQYVSTQEINSNTGAVNYEVRVPFDYKGTLQMNADYEVVFTITSDANYSGTISFGTYDPATGIYIPVAVITLDGVSSATITFTTTGVNHTTISDLAVIETIPGTNSTASTSGTITISEGSVQLGDSAYFSGTVVADESKLVSVNTYGTVLSSDDLIYGGITEGIQLYYNTDDKAYELVDGELTIYGTATMNSFTVTSGELIVDSDAIVTMPADSATYTIDDDFVLTVVGASNGDLVDGAIYDAYGEEIASVSGISLTGDEVTFTLTDGRVLDMSGTYTMQLLMMYTDSGVTTYYMYNGVVTFSVSKITSTTTYQAKIIVSGSSSYSTATVNSGSIVIGSKDIAGTSIDSYSIAYNVNTYKLVQAVVGNSNGGSDSTLSGYITFDTSVGDDQTIMVVLMNKTTGAYVVFYGLTDLGVTDFAIYYNSSTVKAASMSVTTSSSSSIIGQIYSNAQVAVSTSNLDIDDNKVYTLEVDDQLTVDGTLNAMYSSDSSCSIIDNNGNIDVTGIIMYQVEKNGTYSVQINDTINAVAYMVAAASTSTQTYDSYYYTTLTNAMANASNIYVYGEVVVLENTTLTGTPVGTSTSPNTITVVGDLIIGDNDEDSLVTAIVTVPSTSKLVTTGTVVVENGQLKIAGLTSDSGYNVIADVFMVDTGYGVYTDLATALGLASSGDTVTVRNSGDIILANSSTIASGVTLDALSNTIIINAGVTFTVSGVMKVYAIEIDPAKAATSTTSAKAAGVLVFDNYDSNTNITIGILTEGTVTFTTNFDNTGTSDNVFDIGIIVVNSTTKATSAVFNFNGNVNLSAVWTSDLSSGKGYVTLNVPGTLTTENDMNSSDLYAIANVSGTLTAEAILGVSELTVTGSVLLANDMDSSCYVYADVSLVVGTASTTATATTNNAKATVVIGGYAIVYGTPATDAVSIYNDTGVLVTSTTAYYLNTDVLYATAYSVDSYKITTVSNPVITGQVFYGWYEEATFQTLVINDTIGSLDSVYGKLVTQTISITLTYVQNGYWMVNGNVYAGNTVTIDWASSYSISFVADSGYELKDYAVYVNGSAMPLGYTPTAGDVLTFNGTVEAKTISEDTSMEITTILLIIITIVIIIMAIVIVLRLMRS